MWRVRAGGGMKMVDEWDLTTTWSHATNSKVVAE